MKLWTLVSINILQKVINQLLNIPFNIVWFLQRISHYQCIIAHVMNCAFDKIIDKDFCKITII